MSKPTKENLDAAEEIAVPQVAVNPRKVGSIVILRGATSTGKSTICNKILEQNSALDPSQQLNLFLDGSDIAVARGQYKNSTALVSDAVKRSKDGISTIIDIGLIPTDLTPAFLRSCNEEKVSPNLFTALIYSSLSTITERIKARNEAAQKEGGDISNSRPNPSTSICGMSQIFMTPEKFFSSGITTEPKIVGQISYEEIAESVREFGLTSELTSDIINILQSGIGVDKKSTKAKAQDIFVNSKYCDAVFYPSSMEKSDEIAADILEIAKRNVKSQSIEASSASKSAQVELNL